MGKSKTDDSMTTLIGTDAVVDGAVEFKGTIRVDGRVKGRIVSPSGTLIIGNGAVIESEIAVARVVVMGRVDGSITASERIEAYPPSHITGDLQAPVVSIETGVAFEGRCRMTTGGPARIDTVRFDANTGASEPENRS